MKKKDIFYSLMKGEVLGLEGLPYSYKANQGKVLLSLGNGCTVTLNESIDRVSSALAKDARIYIKEKIYDLR